MNLKIIKLNETRIDEFKEIRLKALKDEKYSFLQMIQWFYTDITWAHPVLTAQFFNPHSIWKFVVIMAGVEYAGYLLSRMIGSK
jgi:hypothetical protein